MKKLISYLPLLFLIFALFSCSVESDGDPLDVYREIAYNALPGTDKASIVGDWREAEVSAWTDGNYLVTFQTSDETLGPIHVVVNPTMGTVVEILPRF